MIRRVARPQRGGGRTATVVAALVVRASARAAVLAALLAGAAVGIGAGCRAPAPAGAPDGRPLPPLRVHVAQTQPQEGWRRAQMAGDPVLYVTPEPLLTERDVARAEALHGPDRSILLVHFNLRGAAALQQATGSRRGEWLVVYLEDELVVTAPIERPIHEAGLGIDGGFSRRRVEELMARYNAPRSPAFPAPPRRRGEARR